MTLKAAPHSLSQNVLHKSTDMKQVNVMTRNPPSYEEQNHSPYRILIVDDDDSQRRLERDVLSSVEYELTEARDGETALQLLSEQNFDVVLLDKSMPGMDGDEVCRRIRVDLGLELLPIIMVTANTSREDFLKSMQAGANDFVRKPYNPLELSARTQNFAHQKELTDKLESCETLLFTLARMVEARDGDTGTHCSRLSYMGKVFGRKLGMSNKDIEALRLGGVLHDLGKLGIPDSILLKPGKLNEEEWAIMRQHTVIGDQLISSLKSLESVRPIVRNHHERWDGSGYPDGLVGDEIPLVARVFQLLDIYDALAFARPYKEAFPMEKIIAIMKEEALNGWRDPELNKKFIELLETDPSALVLSEEAVEDPSALLIKKIEDTGALQWGRLLS